MAEVKARGETGMYVLPVGSDKLKKKEKKDQNQTDLYELQRYTLYINIPYIRTSDFVQACSEEFLQHTFS